MRAGRLRRRACKRLGLPEPNFNMTPGSRIVQIEPQFQLPAATAAHCAKFGRLSSSVNATLSSGSAAIPLTGSP
jgi:hypothetical protein